MKRTCPTSPLSHFQTWARAAKFLYSITSSTRASSVGGKPEIFTPTVRQNRALPKVIFSFLVRRSSTDAMEQQE
jgi:hypothetical protein